MSFVPTTDPKVIALRWIDRGAALALLGGVLGVLSAVTARSHSLWLIIPQLGASMISFGVAYGFHYRRSRVVAVLQLIIVVPVLGFLIIGGIAAGANLAVLVFFAMGLVIWIRAALATFRYHVLMRNEQESSRSAAATTR